MRYDNIFKKEITNINDIRLIRPNCSINFSKDFNKVLIKLEIYPLIVKNHCDIFNYISNSEYIIENNVCTRYDTFENKSIKDIINYMKESGKYTQTDKIDKIDYTNNYEDIIEILRSIPKDAEYILE